MIKLTITTKAGTTVSLDIPDTDGAELNYSLDKALSGVVYQDEHDSHAEGPILAQRELLQPSGKRFKSVEDMIASRSVDEVLARENIAGEKKEEGEVGGEEGVLQGEEGEAEVKEEEKPELIYDLDHTVDTALDLFQFPCQTGIYTPPMELTRDFVLAFGEEHVTKEFLKARSWLIANPTKLKTHRGMGRYLNSWLCREAGIKRTPIKESVTPKGDSLLSHGTEDSQGW